MLKQAIKAGALLSLLLLVSASCVYAQGNTLIRKVEIPFDFLVKDKTLPAGVYSVERVNQEGSTLRLRREEGRAAVNIVTNSVQAKHLPKTSKLVFRRYGETYFLAQIWKSDEAQGRQLPKSRTERSIERDAPLRDEKPIIAPSP